MNYLPTFPSLPLNLHLGSGVGHWVRFPCLSQDTSHILLTSSAQRIIHENIKNPERRSNFQQIVSYCLGLPTHNPGLRVVDLEASPKRGSGKINRLRPRTKNTTENKLYHTAWTQKREPSTQVDVEPSTKRITDRTKALVSLYWFSQRLPLKQSINRISFKSTWVDPIKSSRTLKEINQFPKIFALQLIKTNFPKTINSINAHEWGYKWGCHIER